MPSVLPNADTFRRLAAATVPGDRRRVVPMSMRVFADQFTPALAYRRLVAPDQRMAPSFLLESVVGGDRVGRYSYLGAQPAAQIIARRNNVQYIDALNPNESRQYHADDPLAEMQKITDRWDLAPVSGLADFAGGWVGMAGYDTARYLEPDKLGPGPTDDRNLPDLHMGLYRQVVAFDHVQKTVVVMTNVLIDEHRSIDDAYAQGREQLQRLADRIQTPTPRKSGADELTIGQVDLSIQAPPLANSNMGPGGYQAAVNTAKQYIRAGDIFQVVPSQRFELRTQADPFDIYRALRVVNPSPYMFYLQIDGAMLIGSSPEILCRVKDRQVVSRPLAGTRPRGTTDQEDQRLEAELLADPKERAEHVMLVDLGRNDVGRVAQPGTIELPELMAVERYSHVMHISSEVRGRLRDDYTCWDALRHTLPVGTVSGAPKIRAMQIIDQLEPTRRGPYAGAVGYVDLAGNMDVAIALRTMVVQPADPPADPVWIVHLQAGAGIVADSDPDAEDRETRNKAAALAKAVRIAEQAFKNS